MIKLFRVLFLLSFLMLSCPLFAQVQTEQQAKDDTITAKVDTLVVPVDTLVVHKVIRLGKVDTVKKDTVVIVKPDPYKVTTYMYEIPFKRRYFHEDKIDKELKRADLSDGIQDNNIQLWPDTTYSGLLTQTILKDAAFLQVMVENMPANERDSFADHNARIRCLNAVYELLRDYNLDTKKDPIYYRKLVTNLHDMIVAFNEDKLWSFAVKNTNIYSLANSRVMLENNKEIRAYLYIRMNKENPLMMIKRLPEFATDTFAAYLIADVAAIQPDIIFNYATSTNPPLTNAVHRTKDPLVQAIVKITDQAKSPIKAMSFLSDIYKGRKTIDQIDEITDNDDLYFRNIIRLKLANEPIGKRTYSEGLETQALRYVRVMNELHESPDAVRFKALESLSHVDLYYIMVYGQDEIYTSSFLGSFKRLMDKMKPLKGDQLFDTLHYDHFRTFIRMCSGYNTLSEFLTTMDDTSRSAVMTQFISNLQKGKEDELEDAVDVADAFGSITDSALSEFLHNKVKENYELSYKEHSKKGVIIYSLLARLFESNKIAKSDTGAMVVSARLNLPSINKVLFKDLVSDSGNIIYQQVFFFGDEDGLHSYEHFTDLFRKDRNWKMVNEKYWTVISSTTGKKVVIYANLPLPEPQDDDAIDSLCNHLATVGIHPSIMIHRGHSYHLKVSLARLEKHAKIVILGSCGGYHNLAQVLDRSPEAHIISSKQTGTKGVNDEILRSLNASLIAGDDVNWITMWHGLEENFDKKKDTSDKDKFSDYVPPYKNLGAIFIKAYRRMMDDKK